MENRKPRMSFGAGFLSIILCLLLFVTSVCAMALFAVRSTVTREALEEAVEDIDITELGFPDEDGELMTLTDLITDTWGDVLKASGMKARNVARAFDQPYLRDYVRDAVGNYAGYFLEGEELEPLSAAGVRKFLKKRADDLYDDSRGIIVYDDSGKKREETGMPAFRLTGQDIEDLFDELGTDTLDEGFLSERMGIPVGWAAMALSPTGFWALAGASGVLILLLLLIHLRRVRRGFRFAGWTLVPAGGLTAAGGVLLGRVLAERDFGPLQEIAGKLGPALLRTGAMGAGAGLLLAVVFVLLCQLFSHGR